MGSEISRLSTQELVDEMKRIGKAYHKYEDAILDNDFNGSIVYKMFQRGNVNALFVDVGVTSEAQQVRITDHFITIFPISTSIASSSPPLPFLSSSQHYSSSPSIPVAIAVEVDRSSNTGMNTGADQSSSARVVASASTNSTSYAREKVTDNGEDLVNSVNGLNVGDSNRDGSNSHLETCLNSSSGSGDNSNTIFSARFSSGNGNKLSPTHKAASSLPQPTSGSLFGNSNGNSISNFGGGGGFVPAKSPQATPIFSVPTGFVGEPFSSATRTSNGTSTGTGTGNTTNLNTNSPSSSSNCFRCGRSSHWAADCYARTHTKGYLL